MTLHKERHITEMSDMIPLLRFTVMKNHTVLNSAQT